MSMTTPPGWYQDPSAPTQERWWDGNAWSAHTRAPGPQQPPAAAPQQTPQSGRPQQGYGYPAAVPPPQGYGHPGAAPQPQGYGYPGAAPQPQPQGYGYPGAAPQQHGAPPPPSGPPGQGGSGGLSKSALIAVVTAGVVLVAAIITGVVVLGKDDAAAPPVAAPTSATQVPGGGGVPAPPPSTGGTGDPGVLPDQLNGITLPILDGWEQPEFGGDREAATMQTKETYDCPADGGFCHHGTVTSRTATSAETTAEAVAKADIAKATDLAYGRDILDRQKYGGVKSHTEVKSEAVTVAGKQGYLVRWKVVTGKGPGGHVQSLAFPGSLGPGSMVLVRFSFDAGPGGPPIDGMDTITQGIRNTS